MKTKYNRVEFMGRSYRNHNKLELRQFLENRDWTQFSNLTDPGECWDYLLKNIKDEMCPLKYRTVRDKIEPWLSNNIIEAIHDKDKPGKKLRRPKI